MGRSDSDSDDRRSSKRRDDDRDRERRSDRKRDSKERTRREKRSDDSDRKSTKKEQKNKLPFKTSYNVDFPAFVVNGLLEKNGIKGTAADYQLKILLDSKK
ncbi:asparagine-rich antigen [Tritrichomonas foetus]|uniref:Asparagine-rich antigen n=1 Tax=Tritrichomonas foetus TaxID=1144522 RepID=A0A1J4JE52_9EUKA|nr:asparagine-rich antigen [Tritrichomonas foetus]|eukprot:OHS96567.1 asparagine-rich antigen [Tritrichomonas foetus]